MILERGSARASGPKGSFRPYQPLEPEQRRGVKALCASFASLRSWRVTPPPLWRQIRDLAFRLIYPQSQSLLLLVLITTCLLYVWVFTLTVFEGVWVFTLTVFEGAWGSSL